MSKSIRINGIDIGKDFPPYIIAEMSANHNGSIENAYKIIENSKRCGANAVKIQTYKPETLTIKSDYEDFKINEGLWTGKTLYDLYDWAHTPWDWHSDLFNYAHKLGITILNCLAILQKLSPFLTIYVLFCILESRSWFEPKSF